jgi:phosphate starvation-inducible PhoH-like protein
LEKVLRLQGAAEERILLGKRDRHLKTIRRAFDVKLIARGGLLRISGDDSKVEAAAQAITTLIDRIRANGFVRDQDVDAVAEGRELEAHVRADRNGQSAHAGQNGDRRGSDDRYIPGPASRDSHSNGIHATHPRTEGQRFYLDVMRQHDLTFCVGPAGTGKTFLAVAQAVERLRSGEVRKIALVRPALEAGEKLGFLPGDFQAKVNPYLRPIYDALTHILGYAKMRQYIAEDVIEVCPLAYMRGRTLSHAFIILDEAQNTTIEQMKMLLTRFGERSRVVVTGDITQVDLPTGKRSGLADAWDKLRHIRGIGFVQLTRQDIVRHPLIAKIIKAYDDSDHGSGNRVGPHDATPPSVDHESSEARRGEPEIDYDEEPVRNAGRPDTSDSKDPE